MTRLRPLESEFGARRAAVPAALLGLAAVAALQPVRSYDLGWHLASGRWILQERAIPTVDPFSFTRAGTLWLDHEWLFQIGAYAIRSFGGWRLILAVVVAAAMAIAFLLTRTLRLRGAREPATALAVALGLAGIRFRLDFRPETASLLLLVVLTWLLQRTRGSTGWRRPVAAGGLFLLWANLHAGALLGAAVCLIWLIGEQIQGWRGREAIRPDPSSSAATVIALGAVLVNPGGWGLLRVPFDLRRIIVSGHAPNREWTAPAFSDFPLFYGAVGGAVIILALAFRRIDLPPTLATALAAVLGFQQLRNIGFFFALLPLALGPPLDDLLERCRLRGKATRRIALAGVGLAGLLFLKQGIPRSEEATLGRIEPKRALEFLNRHRVGKRLFNDVKFGGALIWARYPEHRVFIDGRNEVYDSLLSEVFQALGSWEQWEKLLQRYRIDAAMLRRGQQQAVIYPPETPGGVGRREQRAFSAAYFQASRWALVYWDDQALIFVRRDDPGARELLDGEYRSVNPDDLPHLLSEIREGRVSAVTALSEVDRKLREDPSCRTASRIRAALIRAAPESGR